MDYDPNDWRVLHGWYGPCDGFGPKGECSVCTGIIQCRDGSLRSTGEYPARVIRKPPLWQRVKAAWAALRYSTP